MQPRAVTADRPLRIGIVGTGGIAAIHADNIRRLDGRARITAACDIDADRVAAFCGGIEGAEAFTDLETMLRSTGLDIVHLCSPPGLHREQALAALRHGVTALSEKPPALSLAEIDEIAGAQAAAGGAVFATISQHRFGGRAQWLRERVADGALGRPMTAVCHTLWYRPDAYFDVPWRGNWEAEGGGPTMGHGIHQMDTMLSILGPWHEVVAVAARRARPVVTEDLSHALVTLADGTVVSVINSLLSPKETSYLRFDFEFATVELDHLYGYGDDNWSITAAPGHEDEVAAAWALGPHGVGSGHAAQFGAVVDALEHGGEVPVALADTRRTLELITAIYASAFTGDRIRPGEIGPSSPFYRSMHGSGAPWDADTSDEAVA